MSLIRVAATRLPLRTCIQAVSTSCQRKTKHQSNFEGVVDAFYWDHNTGFGYTDKKELVLVSERNERSNTTDLIPESQVWLDIIEPMSMLSHDELKNEIQMNVLGYDDNVDQCADSQSNIAVDLISESQVWLDIIEPRSLISHDELRNEIQMNILGYDDTAKQWGNSIEMPEMLDEREERHQQRKSSL